MKRLKINSKQIALIYKNQAFKRILTSGIYWISYREIPTVYEKAVFYNQLEDIQLIIKDSKFEALGEQIKIIENEIVLVFKNELLHQVLNAGNYLYFKNQDEFTFKRIDLNSEQSIDSLDYSVLKNPIVSPYLKIYKVEEFEKALLLINGRLKEQLNSGVYHFWNGALDMQILKADMRSSMMEISGQELLTKDKAALRINFQLEYRVSDIKRALIENKDYQKQLYITAQLAIRSIIGSLTLDEILESKRQIDDSLFQLIKSTSSHLGIQLSLVGLKDFILPGEVKDIMNQVLIAEKQAQANTIARREESASTRSLLNISKLMDENPTLFKLKELEYVEKIAGKIGEIKLTNQQSFISQLSNVLTK